MGHTFTISVPDSYTDVREWLQDLQPGERSRAVCNAIRADIQRMERDERILQTILEKIQNLDDKVVKLQIQDEWSHSTGEGRVPDPDLDGETKENLGGLLT